MNTYEAFIQPAENGQPVNRLTRFVFFMEEGTNVSVWDAVKVIFYQRGAGANQQWYRLHGLRLIHQDRHPIHQSSHGWLVGPPDPTIPWAVI